MMGTKSTIGVLVLCVIFLSESVVANRDSNSRPQHRSKRYVAGPYCEIRPGGCCPGREDDCTVTISDISCFCDEYCERTNGDCCPDYHSFCLGIPPSPPTPVRGECQPSVADVVFVLDSSVSQTAAMFSKQLKFINKFIDHVVLGIENFQIAVITYSFEAQVEIELGQYNESVLLQDAVNNIQFRPGATFTDKGLQSARELIVQTPNKRPYGQLAMRFVFVLTDGMSTNRASTKYRASQLKQVATKVVSIGIGVEVSHQELLDIASPGDTYTPQYVFSVNNFNALHSIVKQLVDLTCDECLWNTTTDVALLLDMSSSMSNSDFEAAIRAVTYLTNMILADDKYDLIRMALVTYGDSIRIVRNLTDTSPIDSLIPKVQGLTFNEGTCIKQDGCVECDSKASNLAEALELMDDTVYGSYSIETRQIVIILSNGMFKVTNEITTTIEQFRSQGPFVFAIGLGEYLHMETFDRLVNDPAYVFTAKFQEEPTNLDVLAAEIFYNSCALSNDFVPK